MLLQSYEQEARANKWKEVSKHFQEGLSSNDQATTILVAALVVLCLALLALVMSRYLKELRQRHRPTVLFMRVGKSMGLGLLDRLWLVRVAKHEQLVSPLVLLMSPSTLDHHANHFMDSLSPSEARHMSHRLRLIRNRLYQA